MCECTLEMCEFTINKINLFGKQLNSVSSSPKKFMKIDLFSPSICLCHQWAHVLPWKGHNRRNATRISSRWYRRYAPTMIPLRRTATPSSVYKDMYVYRYTRRRRTLHVTPYIHLELYRFYLQRPPTCLGTGENPRQSHLRVISISVSSQQVALLNSSSIETSNFRAKESSSFSLSVNGPSWNMVQIIRVIGRKWKRLRATCLAVMLHWIKKNISHVWIFFFL